MNYCANLETLYTELPFLERFAAAKADGFESVEFWDYRDKDLDGVKAAAQAADISISGFNGDADYSLVDPSHKEQYLEELRKSIAAAKKIGAESVTIHSNALGDGGVVVNHYDQLSHTVKLCSMFDTLKESAKIAEALEMNINLEGLNITTDHEGNFLETTQMAAEVVRLVGSDRLKVLYDAYHMQLNEGSVCDTLSAYVDVIGHIHIADAPGRHEPGTGEMHYNNIMKHLKNLGYKYRIGSELFPLKDTKTAVKAIMSTQPE